MAGARYVNFMVSDVQVPAENDRLTTVFFKMLEIVTEGLVPFETIRQAPQSILRVGCLDVDEHEVRVFSSNHAAFAVVFLKSHANENVQWFYL